jgi:hypothetical protein
MRQMDNQENEWPDRLSARSVRPCSSRSASGKIGPGERDSRDRPLGLPGRPAQPSRPGLARRRPRRPRRRRLDGSEVLRGRGSGGAVRTPAPDAASRPGSIDVLADWGDIAAGRDASVRTLHGLSGLQTALIMAVVVGAVLLAGSMLGRRITASNCGIAVGGSVSGSTVAANCPAPASR